MRGGYQITHLLPGNSLSWIDADVGRLPGLEFSATDSGGSTYRDFTNIVIPLAIPSTIEEPVIVSRSPIVRTAQTFFAPDYVTPYVQTFTLGVTRSLPANLILDVRYVGTRGVKLHSTLNYNEPDFRNNGLIQALEVTRAGGNDPMFDRMLNGLNFGTGIGVVGQGGVTGSEALRRHATFRTNIANGDFRAVANTLNTTNIGSTSRQARRSPAEHWHPAGCSRRISSSRTRSSRAMEMRNNSDMSTYHSMQTQVTMRPVRGITTQATWTWSRATGVAGNTPAGGGITAAYRDFLNRERRLHRGQLPPQARFPRLQHDSNCRSAPANGWAETPADWLRG